ncbi:hypothetical protein AB0I60_19060 [Actinosynnema sp. NPDC050436]|uniref:hypothetical protein n=1 Tax=Actinosynnema sp. NPDC050436 TaxID=3155659 RepID=UPI0033D7E6B4
MRAWLDEALAGRHYAQFAFDSVHVDEVTDDYTESRALELGFHYFDQLVVAYEDRAADLMARMVIVLRDEGELDLRAPELTELGSEWDGFTPPDLYITARKPIPRPYFVEEYKKPYPVGSFRAPHGVYHAYYRSHRQDDTIDFGRTVNIEHYPLA